MESEQSVRTKEYDDRIEIRYENESGDAVFTVYKVFSGITLVFSAIHTDQCKLLPVIEGELIEISHCREGRIEIVDGGDYFYLSPGDLSVTKRSRLELNVQLPLCHYHGVSIIIQADFVPKVFSTMLKDTPVNPAEVAERLCKGEGHYIARAQEYVEHIFSEFYSVPESIRIGYFKIKILELLLMLSCVDTEDNMESSRRMSLEQVELAKKVSEYLHANMDKRPTISELSQRFHISQTKLKEVFRGVYGVPIYSYMKIQKMQSAALQLISTERTILDIALDYSYSSGSKFAAAFREIMGESPQDYRRAHSKTQCNLME